MPACERVLPPVRRAFRAMAEAFVPEASELDGHQWARAEVNVERSLAPRPPEIKRQLRLFIRVADGLAVFRYGRTLKSVDRDRREAFLHRLETSPVLLLRRGTWGVRTLAFMAIYGLPEVRDALGYRAHPDGWDARRERGAHPDRHASGDMDRLDRPGARR